MKDNFKIITVRNGVPFREHGTYQMLFAAQKQYNKLLPKNQVFFEKKFLNYFKIEDFCEELLFLKKKPDNYVQQYHFLHDGRMVKEIVYGDWIVAERAVIKYEEKFYVYGLKKRMTFMDIFNKVFLEKPNDIYQVLMFFNKILVVNDSYMEFILCKNIADCQRFYNLLFDLLKNNGKFAFFGHASRKVRLLYSDRITALTGLKRQELWRTSTRG